MKIRISQQLSSQSSTIGDLSYSINEAAQFDLRERVHPLQTGPDKCGGAISKVHRVIDKMTLCKIRVFQNAPE